MNCLSFSLTSSKMRSFSSICLNSCLDRLCLLLGVGLDEVPLFSLSCVKKVGCPSTVLNIGFRSPLLSNSWADILRTGVVAPELHLEWLVPCVGDVTMSTLFEEFKVACETNQASTTCRVAFLQEKRNLLKNISLYGWADVIGNRIYKRIFVVLCFTIIKYIVCELTQKYVKIWHW